MSEEELFQDAMCDTLELTYTDDIQPIFEANCYECHNSGYQSGGFNSQDTLEIAYEIDRGVLLNAIKRVSGYPQMPKDREKLQDCLIKKIEVWNREGRIN
jgi:hypothetical protein